MKQINRRNLVQAAALLPLQTVRGSAQNSAVKVGLIGAGSRGSYTASMVAKNPRARITAICDVVDENIAKAKDRTASPDAKAFKNYQDLLASDVDYALMDELVVEYITSNYPKEAKTRLRFGAVPLLRQPLRPPSRRRRCSSPSPHSWCSAEAVAPTGSSSPPPRPRMRRPQRSRRGRPRSSTSTRSS